MSATSSNSATSTSRVPDQRAGDAVLRERARPDPRPVSHDRHRQHVDQRRRAASSTCRPAQPQVLRGTTGLVVPDLGALAAAAGRGGAAAEGHAASPSRERDVRRGDLPVGQPHPLPRAGRRASAGSRSACPMSSSTRRAAARDGIARFYQRDPRHAGDLGKDGAGPFARVAVGARRAACVFRETDRAAAAVRRPPRRRSRCADFSGPHRRLLERGLITEESNQHQYRFEDVVDLDSGEVLSPSSTRCAACATRCSPVRWSTAMPS